MRPEPGQVWLADLGIAAKVRPVVIVSRRDDNPPRDLVTFVPCSSQFRSSRYEVPLPKTAGVDHESWANVQGIGALPRTRLIRRVGIVPADAWGSLREALRFGLDL
jgi:mRNA interferase MazF